MIESIVHYSSIFFIFSILGWFGELLLYPIIKKSVITRGFLRLPWCPIYGFASIIIIFLIKLNLDILLFIISSAVIFSLLEYLTSYFLEKIFKRRWWDYSKSKLNINGRIALNYILSFVVYALFFRYLVYPLLDFSKINFSSLLTINIILLFFLIVDIIYSLSKNFDTKKPAK